MAKIKTAKNLVSNRSEYNAYYGDFRGVDFSSDHTQVANSRFAYLVNMYKDYKSANGTAIETIPGFRRVFSLSRDGNKPSKEEVHGIYTLNGIVLVHVGKHLAPWFNFPNSCGIRHSASMICTKDMQGDLENEYQISLHGIVRDRGGKLGGYPRVFKISYKEDVVLEYEFDGDIIKFAATELNLGDVITIEYAEDTVVDGYLTVEVPDEKSVAFQYGGRLLFFSGGKMFSVTTSSSLEAPTIKDFSSIVDEDGHDIHIPTTYTKLVQGGDNEGTEYEQRNLLSPYFRNEFYGSTNTTQVLQLMAPFSEILSVKQINYDAGTTGGGDPVESYLYDYVVDRSFGTVTITGAYNREVMFVVTAKYRDGLDNGAYVQKIAKCTKGCLFDNRLFLSGNPDFPNTVWFSTPLDQTDYALSFGADDWFNDGVNDVPVAAMIPVSDNLLVIKERDEEGGSAYLHSKLLTEDNIVTKAYPREQGLQGIGCIGACTNFYDDPIFISPLGVSALGQLSVKNERALEHRSTLIDAKLVNMDLKKSFIVEQGGYMWLFVDGCVFLADSRQRYTDGLGVVQYEWYYIEGVGTYEDLVKNDVTGAYEGGTFHPATCARTMDENVFFGTSGGVVCAFNFDKRSEYGDILPEWYTFDGRTIVSGCATRMDNLGIPHLTKSTVKKSMVLKLKTLLTSSLKIKVRTNVDPYKQVARIGSGLFSFEAMDFEDFSFVSADSGLFAVKEKEKKWVEKQIYLYSDEHMRPFALYYIAFRYFIAGRLKN